MSQLSKEEIEAAKAILKDSGYKIEKKKSNSGGCLIALFVFLFVGYMIVSDTNNDSGTSSYSVTKTYGSNDGDKLEAYNNARDFVKKRLKSPSSAKFPDSQQKVDDTEYIGDNTYKIRSYVESQNSFGAMIRTDFSCKIRFEGRDVYCSELILY